MNTLLVGKGSPEMGQFSQAKVDYIFVYGTLKTYGIRNSVLKDCTYVDLDYINGYMFSAQGAYPKFVPEPIAPKIMGEVWELPKTKAVLGHLMGELDTIEGVPNLYWRMPFILKSGKIAWIYYINKDKIENNWEFVLDGVWRNREPNQTENWKKWIDSHIQYRFPTKPLGRYSQLSQSWVVDQNPPEGTMVRTAWEVGGGTNDAHKVTYLPKKEVKPLIELAWLDDVKDTTKPPEVCPKIRVDGI